MIACPTVTKQEIQKHYDLASLFYRLFWGVHVHHGLWEADESPHQAQLRLIERLASETNIRPGMQVLDVGCGMGGSSIHLAQHFGCRVTGLTLSPVQRYWASCTAWWQGVRPRVRFICQDVETIEYPPNSFDVVWSIECTEHLFDKPQFFGRAASWLHPGGRIALCAWLAGNDSPETAYQVYEVCEGFLCPSLGTAEDYRTWMHEAGFEICVYLDLTEKVTRTWEICIERVRRYRVHRLAALAGPRMTCFVARFNTILNAYRTGAMHYGCFVAQVLGTPG